LKHRTQAFGRILQRRSSTRFFGICCADACANDDAGGLRTLQNTHCVHTIRCSQPTHEHFGKLLTQFDSLNFI